MFGGTKHYEKRLVEMKELYEARIQDLKLQIEDLRSLTIPRSVPTGIPLVQYEADAILSGKQETTVLNSDGEDKTEVEAEAQRILSGAY